MTAQQFDQDEWGDTPTPQVTIEAIMHSVRERGLTALNEPATQKRLCGCDDKARSQINERIAKLIMAGRVLEGQTHG